MNSDKDIKVGNKNEEPNNREPNGKGVGDLPGQNAPYSATENKDPMKFTHGVTGIVGE